MTRFGWCLQSVLFPSQRVREAFALFCVLCVCVCVCMKNYVHWSDTPLLENLPWLLGVLVAWAALSEAFLGDPHPVTDSCLTSSVQLGTILKGQFISGSFLWGLLSWGCLTAQLFFPLSSLPFPWCWLQEHSSTSLLQTKLHPGGCLPRSPTFSALFCF